MANETFKADAPAVIAAYVAGESANSIQRRYALKSPQSVIDLLVEHNVPTRGRMAAASLIRYALNHDYFAAIDSHEKAQILGLIYADGCVYRHKGTDTMVLRFELNAIDEPYLHHIKAALGYEGTVQNGHGGRTRTLSICSRKLCADLINLGAVERKTFLLRFPTPEQVPDEFMGSFLLGYFEGDGSIYTNVAKRGPGKEYPRTFISMIGTHHFVSGYQQHITAMGIRSSVIDAYSSIFRTQVSGQQDVLRLMGHLYSKAPFVMARKHARYMAFKDWLAAKSAVAA